jgi:DNA polymerase-4
MTLRWLILDFNAFFASCETAADPALAGRPLAIVPSLTDSTCAIAANYAAKKFGIKTGTSVTLCKQLCPRIELRVARHRLYVEYHHRLLAVIEKCLPITQVLSIDEVACGLLANEQSVPQATALAQHIKNAIRTEISPHLTASIGIAPTRILAKLASDMQKPDGLTILPLVELPARLLHLAVDDFCGIGDGMHARLAMAGIHTVADLYARSRAELKTVWGGIEGERFYDAIHGIEPERPETQTRSIGHQHVLEPMFRHRAGAERFARYLLGKAAQRLRKTPFACRRLDVHLKCQRPFGYWQAAGKISATQDTQELLAAFTALWQTAPHTPPLRVGITLSDFTPLHPAQLSLFDARPSQQREERQVRTELCGALDKINGKYGSGTIGFGGVRPDFKDFNGRIAFTRIPSLDDF